MPEEDQKPGADRVALEKTRFHIGLLDIFGFEKFDKKNSFEQFCINYTNEKLQQLYIGYVFKSEEKEFINEDLGAYLGELNFIDNTEVIELMDGKDGIFGALDDVCKVAKDNMSDEPFFQKITKTNAKSAKFKVPKMSRDKFIIIHTAKDVDYDTNGFVFKNQDELGENIAEAVLGSSEETVVKIFKGLAGDDKEVVVDGKVKNEKYLGAKFRAQMVELMTELSSCDCHFMRCLKPNEEKRFKLFRPGLTLQQIRYLGVLDSIKIRKDGFPIRHPYKGFYEKYESLNPESANVNYKTHLEKGSNFRELTTK